MGLGTIWQRGLLVQLVLALVAAALAVTGVSLASAAVPGEADDPLAAPPLVTDEAALLEDDPGSGEQAPPDPGPDPRPEPEPGAGTEPDPGGAEPDSSQPESPEPAPEEAAAPEPNPRVDVETASPAKAPVASAVIKLPSAGPGTVAPAAAAVVKDLSVAPGESPRPADRKGEESGSAQRSARVASHGGFVACHGVAEPDKAACEELLTRLLDEELRVCGDARFRDPACQEAAVRFAIESACVDQPDRDACRARLQDNPCFEDPLSRACNGFLVTREVLACRGETSEIPSFRCRVIGGALEFFCLEHQAAGIPVDTTRCPQAGPGFESTRPGAREGTTLASAPGAGGGASTLVGLQDPGGRGDLGLAATGSGGESKPKAKLARTGLALPGLLLAGLLMAGGGLALRRRVRH